MKKIKLLITILILFVCFGCANIPSGGGDEENPPIYPYPGDGETENPPVITPKYTLTLHVVNDEEGTIDDVSGDYEYGKSVTLIAYPNPGYMFGDWHDTSGFVAVSDNPYTLVITKNINIDVHFMLIPEDDHYEYHIIDEKVEITKYINSSFLDDGNVVIPSTIEGYPVTTIGYMAFSLAGIYSVTIPSSVTRIEERGFYLSSLNKIIFGDSLTYVGGEAFLGNNIVHLNLPSSLTEIGVSAFSGKYLEDIYIPISVIKIGERAFGDNFPQTITTEHMKKPVFWAYNWKNINCEVIWSTTQNDLVSDELIFSLNSDNTLSVASYYGEYYTLVDLVVPSLHKGKQVTKIGYRGFFNCTGLKTVVIPSSITSIGEEAFYYCHRLISVELSSNVTSIGQRAFYGCINLISIILPSSLVEVGNSVFSYDSTYLSIYCEADTAPEGWGLDWANELLVVYWNGEWYLDEAGVPHPFELAD